MRLKRPLWRGERIVQLGPGLFVVGLDGGGVFSQSEAHAEDGVHVRIGYVVNKLADWSSRPRGRGCRAGPEPSSEMALRSSSGNSARVSDGGGAIFGRDGDAGGGRGESGRWDTGGRAGWLTGSLASLRSAASTHGA